MNQKVISIYKTQFESQNDDYPALYSYGPWGDKGWVYGIGKKAYLKAMIDKMWLDSIGEKVG